MGAKEHIKTLLISIVISFVGVLIIMAAFSWALLMLYGYR